MNALSGFGQEYPLLVYVHERKQPVVVEESGVKVINDENNKAPVFKPMIEDTKALVEEEKTFNDKFNVNNNINRNLSGLHNMNNINNSNYSDGVDEEIHNVLPSDYYNLPKPTKKKK